MGSPPAAPARVYPIDPQLYLFDGKVRLVPQCFQTKNERSLSLSTNLKIHPKLPTKDTQEETNILGRHMAAI